MLNTSKMATLVAMNSITRLTMVGTPNVDQVPEMAAAVALSRPRPPVSEAPADPQRERQVVVIALDRLRRIGRQLHAYAACRDIGRSSVHEPALAEVVTPAHLELPGRIVGLERYLLLTAVVEVDVNLLEVHQSRPGIAAQLATGAEVEPVQRANR